MSVQDLRVSEPSLNSVAAGLELAERAIGAIRGGASVRIDLSAALRMTPSFANALVMSMLDALGVAAFNDRVTMTTGSDLVREAWQKAIERYERGVRLSTQHRNGA